MEKRTIKTNDKKEFKEFLVETKAGFIAGISDKKRWAVSLLQLFFIGLIITADLLTKKYVYGYCNTVKDVVLIEGVLRFTAVENTGASFGIFKNQTSVLTGISTVCAAILFVLIFYVYKRKSKLLKVALVMITGGAVGNIIDRLSLGYVRDFIYFELIDFAVFNIADSFLTVGTILLAIYVLFVFGKEENELAKQKAALAENNGGAESGGENTENDGLSDSGETAAGTDGAIDETESLDEREKHNNNPSRDGRG